MTYNPSYIADLLIKSLTGNLKEEEQHLLDHWQADDPRHPPLVKALLDEERLKKYYEEYRPIDRRAIWDGIRARLPDAGLPAYQDKAPSTGRLRRLIRNRTAAIWLTLAAIGLLIAVTTTLIRIGHKPARSVVANVPVVASPVPGVMLNYNLRDSIDLNTVLQGWRFQYHNLLFIKPEEGLVQISMPDSTAPVIPISLTTPKGRYYRLRLPDNSTVDLNAESRLEMDSFYLQKRRVTLQGEAYFDISREASRPFDVEIRSLLTITAMGTAFDVKAYPEDSLIRTRLVTGMLRISNTGGGQRLLRPHHTVMFDRKGQFRTAPKKDTTTEIAWVNGQFDYNRTPILEILSDLSHWYNVDIELRGKPQGRFTFSCSRKETLGFTLSRLAATKHLRYDLSGNKAIIYFDQP